MSREIKFRVWDKTSDSMLYQDDFERVELDTKNKMVTLTARAGRRGKATSFGHMCHSCFMKWLTTHNIPVPDLDKKEINEDDKEKL